MAAACAAWLNAAIFAAAAAAAFDAAAAAAAAVAAVSNFCESGYDTNLYTNFCPKTFLIIFLS